MASLNDLYDPFTEAPSYRLTDEDVMTPAQMAGARSRQSADPVSESITRANRRKGDLGRAWESMKITRDQYLDGEGAGLFVTDPITKKRIENPDGSFVPEMETKIQTLREKAAQKVGFFRGALTPAVAGDPTDEATAAEKELAALEPQYIAKKQKYDRIQEQMKRVRDAHDQTEVELGQLSAARISRTDPQYAEDVFGSPAAAPANAQLTVAQATPAQAAGPSGATPAALVQLQRQVKQAQEAGDMETANRLSAQLSTGMEGLDPERQQRVVAATKDPTFWGEFGKNAKDFGMAFGAGSNALLKMVGDLYGLATGDMDNAVSKAGQYGVEYFNQRKSQELQNAEAARKQVIDSTDGELSKAWAYVKETVANPALLTSALAEQLPNTVGSGGAGAVARVGAEKLLLRKISTEAAKRLAARATVTEGAKAIAGKAAAKLAAEKAAKIGVGTAIGTGAALQGADVGGSQYDELLANLEKMPTEEAMKIPEIAQLVGEGANIEQAKLALALTQARKTAVAAGVISLGAQLIPGAQTLEKTLVGGAGGRSTRGRLAAAGAGALGEAVSEVVEEGGGQIATNVEALPVDPNRPLFQGVGEASGQAALTAGIMGGAAGAYHGGHNPNTGNAKGDGGGGDAHGKNTDGQQVPPGGADAATPPGATGPKPFDQQFLATYTDANGQEAGQYFDVGTTEEAIAAFQKANPGIQNFNVRSPITQPPQVDPDLQAELDAQTETEAATTATTATTQSGGSGGQQTQGQAAPAAPPGETPPQTTQRVADTLGVGDVVTTDTGDTFEILHSVPHGKGDRLIDVRWDDGKETTHKASELESLLTPQPYIDATTGERKMSRAADIRKSSSTQGPESGAGSAPNEVAGQETPPAPAPTAPTTTTAQPLDAGDADDLGDQAAQPASTPEGVTSPNQGQATAPQTAGAGAVTPAPTSKDSLQVPAAPERREAWQMTREEFAESNPSATDQWKDQRRNVTHPREVELALKAGKDVPAAVLAEYPELAAKYAPKESTAPAPEPETEKTFKLPRDLAGAKPRYKNSTLNFESELDKALYILAQEKPSKRDADFARAVAEHTGMDLPAARRAGFYVRLEVSTLARDQGNPAEIRVPTVHVVTTSRPSVSSQPSATSPGPTTSVTKPQATKPEAGEKSIRTLARGTAKPAAAYKFIINNSFGTRPTARAGKFLEDFIGRMHKMNNAAFEGMEIQSLSQADWDAHPELSKELPGSAAAYHPGTNTLYLNRDKTQGDSVVNAFVHEMGHFAEKFALGEDFAQREWEKLTDQQRSDAWKQYNRLGEDGKALKQSRRARAEWVAYQFARVVRGDVEGMSKGMVEKLKAFLDEVRSVLNKWIGDGKLTTKELDAKILEALGYSEPTEKEHTLVGQNDDGKNVYVDKRGVRHIEQTSGILVSEPVGLVPTREGARIVYQAEVRTAKQREGTAFETVEEKATRTAEKPAPPAPPPPAPPKAPAPKADMSDVDKLADDLFGGLLGTPATPDQQTGFPEDDLPKAIAVARAMIRAGLRTPEAMAGYLDEKYKKQARKYSQALWNMFGAVDPSLSGVHDWSKIYAAAETPATPPPAAPPAPKPEEPAAKEPPSEEDMRALILADESRAVKSVKIRRMAEDAGVTVKEMQEMLEGKLVRIVNEVVRIPSADRARTSFVRTLGIYDRQPLFSGRTSTSIENQAYSTPAPLAYAMSHAVGVTSKTQVYEPTAGTGMLMIGSEIEDGHGNEINDARREELKKLGVGTITDNDATDYTPRKKFGVVMANPPFGPVKNTNVDGYGLSKLEHVISAKALAAMKDDGKAVLILGANMTADVPGAKRNKGAQWVFENYLASHYNVADIFEVSGDLYANQGAQWPVRVIVIDGRKTTPDGATASENPVERLNNWDDVWKRAEKIRHDTQTKRTSVGTGGQTGLADNPPGRPGAAQNEGTVSPQVKGPAGAAGAGSNTRPDRGDERPAAGQHAQGGVHRPAERPAGQPADTGSVNVQPGERRPPEPPVEVGDRGSTDQRPDGTGSREQGSGPANTGVVPRSVSLDQAQITYEPRSEGSPFGTLTPRSIGDGTHAALDALKKRVGPIDAFVAEKINMSVEELRSVLAADQIDGAALAIDQIENGGALIIGDETGIGKGRQAAAVIRYAMENGKIPVFFTKDPKLFSDMFADLKDIHTDVNPLIFGEKDKASIVDKEGKVLRKAPDLEKQRLLIKKAEKEGLSAAGFNAIFSTYSQVNKRNERQEFLEELMRKNDTIIVLDEAHEAAGKAGESMQAAFMTGGEIERGKGAEKTTVVVPGLLNANGTKKGRGGVVYLSATYAKRPNNMPLYYRTLLSRAAQNFEQIVTAMEEGGVALQQAVSEALAKAGQYIRRERDFDGIKYNTKIVGKERKEEVVQDVDNVTSILRDIVSFSKEAKKKAGAAAGGKGTAMTENQMAMTDFGSVVHNNVAQLLLAAKAEAVVEEAIAIFKRGEKPIITLMNTMGSFLEDYVTQENVKPGGKITLSWESLLKRALNRTMRVTVKKPNGSTEILQLTPAQIGMQEEYDAIIDKIDETTPKNLPVSPIDYIIQRLEDAGIRMGELTGRSKGIKYDNYETGESTYRRFKVANKNKVVNSFQNGNLDGILLNAAGSTGLSLHASTKLEKKNQQKRHMIIAQPALDINVYMQTLGRTKRTGMAKGSAEYTQLAMPLQAEIRPSAVTKRKMASLNANTTSDTDSAVKIEARDIFNKYGDEIVMEYLANNPEIKDATGIDVEDRNEGSTRAAEEDLAMKFMGKMALLPNATQEKVYEEIFAEYDSVIEQLKATGEYDLDISAHDDWDAVKTSDEQLKAGEDDSNILTSGVRLQKWDMTENRSTPSGEEMRREFEKRSGTREKVLSQWEDYKKSILEKARAQMAKADTDLKKAAITKQYTQWQAIARGFDFVFDRIGETVEIADDKAKTSYTGMLVGVDFPESEGAAMRTAPSGFKFRFMVDDPAAKLNLSGSRVGTQYNVTPSSKRASDFKGGKRNTRDGRWVVVGNPIQSYDVTGGTGKMVRFKTRDGEVVTGLLMKRDWSAEDLANDPRFELATPKNAARFIADQPTWGYRVGLRTRDNRAKILFADGSRMRVEVPANKASQDYSLDEKLRGIFGDFTKIGNRMEARFNRDDTEKVAKRLMEISGGNLRPTVEDESSRPLVDKANGVKPSAPPPPSGQQPGQPLGTPSDTGEPPQNLTTDTVTDTVPQHDFESVPSDALNSAERSILERLNGIYGVQVSESGEAGVFSIQRIRAGATGNVGREGSEVPGTARRYLEALKRAFGKQVVFYRSNNGAPTDFDGFVPGTNANAIGVDAEANSPLAWITGHELTHSLQKQQPELYNQLEAAVLDMAEKSSRSIAYRSHLAKLYPHLTDGKRTEELVADFVGTEFRNPDFWRGLAARMGDQFTDLVEAALAFLDQIIGRTSKFPRDVSKVFDDVLAARKVLADVLAEYSRLGDFPQQERLKAAPDDSLAANDSLLGTPGETRKSQSPRTERAAGFPVEDRTYAARSIEEADAEAKAFIATNGESTAAAVALDPSDTSIPGDTRTRIIKQLMDRRSQRMQDPNTSPEEQESIARELQNLSASYNPDLRDAARQLSARQNLLSDPRAGAIDQHTREVQEDQDNTLAPAGQQAVDESMKAINDVKKDAVEKAVKAVEKKLDEIPLTKSVWQEYREDAANQVADWIDGKTPPPREQDAPLKEFTDRILKEIRSRLPKPEKEPGAPEPLPSAALREAVENKEKYAELIKTARDTVEKQYGKNSAELDRFDMLLGDLGLKPYSKRLLDKAIKQAHDAMKTRVRDVARMHYTKADRLHRDMATALMEEAGLSKERAAEVTEDLRKRMDELTAGATTKALDQLKKRADATPRKRRVIDAISKATTLNNLGALSRADVIDAVAKELKLPKVSAATLKKLSKIADRIETAKNQSERSRAELDMLNALRIARGFTKLDVAMSVWYANLLSGFTTHGGNAFGNFTNGTAQLASVMATDPKHGGEALRGWIDGFGEGWSQAKSIMKTGRGSREFDARTNKTNEAGNVLELIDYKRDFPDLNGKIAAGLQKHAKVMRYVTRAMKAMDSLFYYPAREAYARVATAKLLEGQYEGKELYQKTREMLGIAPDQLVAAAKQAESEGFTGIDLSLRTANIIEENRRKNIGEENRRRKEAGNLNQSDAVKDSEDFALEATYNNDPQGWAGILYQKLVPLIESVRPGGAPILKAFLPFLRVPTNVFNASMNFTPQGAVRALRGMPKAITKTSDGKFHVERREFTKDEQKRLLAQSIGGSLAMAGLAALALGAGGDDDEDKNFDITATGPDDFRKRQQLEATGWRPHSIKIGDTWISYKDSPLLLPLSIAGHVVDAVRYKKQDDELTLGNKVTNAVMTAPRAIFDTSMLSGLGTLMNYAGGGASAKQVENFLARTAVTAAIPSMLSQIDKTFNPEVREANGPLGAVGAATPFLRNTGDVKTDVLGEPVTRNPMQRFGGFETNDPLRGVLVEKKVFISTPSRDTKLGNEPMDEDTYRVFVKISGERINNRLRPFTGTLRRMPAEQVERTVDKVVREERERAKNILRAQAISR